MDSPFECKRSLGEVDGPDVKWTFHQKVDGPSKSGLSPGQSERCKRLKLKRRKLCRSDENKGVKVDGLSDESGRSS